MKTLIKKDITLVGALLNFGLFPLAMTFTLLINLLIDNFHRVSVYVGILLIIIHIVNSIIWAYDTQYKSDILLNSLPIDRKTIVASRYVTILFYLVAMSTFIFIMGLALASGSRNFFMYAISLNEILNTVSLVIVLMAIYLAVYYYGSYRKKMPNDITLFVVASAYVIMRYLYINNNTIFRVFNGINLNHAPFISIIVAGLAYFLSMKLSIRMYNKLEM